MTDTDTVEPDEEVEQEWEVCIRAYGPDDEPGEARWEHYHPTAPDEETAKEKAVEEAKNGFDSIIGHQDAYDIVEVYKVDMDMVSTE